MTTRRQRTRNTGLTMAVIGVIALPAELALAGSWPGALAATVLILLGLWITRHPASGSPSRGGRTA